MSLYRSKEWFVYHAACIAAADGVCQNCGGNRILQVHHPSYVVGRKPWEYPIEHCKVLCRGCHAEVHGLILPREGWIIVDNDLERNEPSDPVPCANCGKDVRWHFTIYHPQWGETIVGSECAENLSIGPEVSALKSYLRRLKTFLGSPRWKTTPKGFRIQQEGSDVLVFRKGSSYRIKINEKWGEVPFSALEHAKQKVFEVLEHRRRKKELQLAKIGMSRVRRFHRDDGDQF